MSSENFTRRRRKSESGDGFRISIRPIVISDSEHQRAESEFADAGLPRVYGAPMLFVIARDPLTLFVCWSIDWPTIFAEKAPIDKQVHLRVYRADGAEEKRVAVEPMAGNCYVEVSHANGSYRVELGYYQPADVWNSVANSNEVMMSDGRTSKNADIDVATIPFHFSFQRLLDLFEAAGGEGLARLISGLEARASGSNEKKQLSLKERAILHAMNLSLSEIAAARRSFDETNSEKLARRTDALLGFGPTSPSRGFEGDWASAGS
jgi:Domain of unknown function (DUF4912)